MERSVNEKFIYLSLPNRKPWTSSTESFSPIMVAFPSAPAVESGEKSLLRDELDFCT